MRRAVLRVPLTAALRSRMRAGRVVCNLPQGRRGRLLAYGRLIPYRAPWCYGCRGHAPALIIGRSAGGFSGENERGPSALSLCRRGTLAASNWPGAGEQAKPGPFAGGTRTTAGFACLHPTPAVKTPDSPTAARPLQPQTMPPELILTIVILIGIVAIVLIILGQFDRLQ